MTFFSSACCQILRCTVDATTKSTLVAPSAANIPYLVDNIAASTSACCECDGRARCALNGRSVPTFSPPSSALPLKLVSTLIASSIQPPVSDKSYLKRIREKTHKQAPSVWHTSASKLKQPTAKIRLRTENVRSQTARTILQHEHQQVSSASKSATSEATSLRDAYGRRTGDASVQTTKEAEEGWSGPTAFWASSVD
jgi:hypothetical protein